MACNAASKTKGMAEETDYDKILRAKNPVKRRKIKIGRNNEQNEELKLA